MKEIYLSSFTVDALFRFSVNLELSTLGVAMDILTEFQTKKVPKLIYGCGALSQVPDAIRGFGTRIFIVTDQGIAGTGSPTKLKDMLVAADYACEIYTDSQQNPTESDAENCAVSARDFQPDLIIGLGGGSSMDTAKACNFLYTNGGRMEDYMGYGKAEKPMLPLVCIPTTSGTGSECQSFALISRDSDHKKMPCGDSKNAAFLSVLDPELTVSQPREVTANTGVDAIAHAVETYVSLRATPFSMLYSSEAFRLLSLAFPKVLREPDNVAARGAMLLGAAYAGMAIENSMLGAAHGCANPLTARFDMTHGQAVGIMLPAVVRKNSEKGDIADRYKDLLNSVAGDKDCQADSLDQLLEKQLAEAGIPLTLESYGVVDDDVGVLAEDAEGQWTSSFNPIPLCFRDFTEIYGSVLNKNL